MARELCTIIELGNYKFSGISAELEDDKVKGVVGWAEVPARGIKKGVPTDLRALAHGIEELWDEMQRRSAPLAKEVYVTVACRNMSYSIRRGDVIVGKRTITREHVDTAIENAKVTDVPKNKVILVTMPRFFTLDDSTHAQNPIGMVSSTLEVEVFMVLAPSTWVANIKRAFNLAGIRLADDSIIPAGIASGMAVLTSQQLQHGVMMMDIGHGTTSILIYHNGSPSMYFTLPLGGFNFTYDLTIALHVSEDEAVNLKHNILTLDLHSVDDNDMLKYRPLYQTEERIIRMRNLITDVLAPRMDLIIENTFRLIERAYAGVRPPMVSIVLTGGGALLKGIDRYISDVLDGIPVAIGMPSEDWVPDDLRSPSYSALIGSIKFLSRKLFSERYYELEPASVSTSRRRRTVFRKVWNWISEFF